MLPIYPLETNPLDELSLHEQEIQAFGTKLRNVRRTIACEDDQLHNEAFDKCVEHFNAMNIDDLTALRSVLIDEKSDKSLHDQDRADSLIQRVDDAVFPCGKCRRDLKRRSNTFRL